MSKALFCTLGIFKIPAAADWVYKRGNTATCDGILHWPDSWSKIWFKSALWAHQKHSKGSQSVLTEQNNVLLQQGKFKPAEWDKEKQKSTWTRASPVLLCPWTGEEGVTPVLQSCSESSWCLSEWHPAADSPESPGNISCPSPPRLSCASPPSSRTLRTPAPPETFCRPSGYTLVTQQ